MWAGLAVIVVMVTDKWKHDNETSARVCGGNNNDLIRYYIEMVFGIDKNRLWLIANAKRRKSKVLWAYFWSSGQVEVVEIGKWSEFQRFTS